MLLKYFYNTKLAQASYMVGCQATGEAIVVDPNRDIHTYLHAAEQEGVRIVAVTETHIHADFLSGARELAERTAATLYLSDEGDANWKYQYASAYKHRLVKDGDHFMIGNIRFDVMHTPGHTPEHISFVVTDTAGASKPMGIFTGDFVFVGDVGRPDLLEKAAGIANTADAGARQMFRSLQRFKALPDYLQVWPGHGAGSACGKALGAIPSSTVGYEKLFNWALSHDDEQAFVQALLAGQPEPPYYFARMKKLNKVGPQLLHDVPAPDELAADRVLELVENGAMVVDTRPAAVFAAEHLPGTINLPRDSSFVTWAGWLLSDSKPVYLIIDSADVNAAITDLASIGFDNIAGYAEPGVVTQLAEGGVVLEHYHTLTVPELAAAIEQDELEIVDVRGQSEWLEGHLPGARHIMLGYLPKRSAEIPAGKRVVLVCRSGNRSAIAASVLQTQGIKNVVNLLGGFRDWQAARLPIAKNGSSSN